MSKLYLVGLNITMLCSGCSHGLNSLVHLDIWINQINSLPNDIFAGIEYIYFLNISGSQIKYYYVDTLLSLLANVVQYDFRFVPSMLLHR